MEKLNESGRSMVEMLGVLAIIGVLSIGGIAGYTQAMRKYRANNLVDCMSKASAAAQVKLVETATSSEWCFDNFGGGSLVAAPITGYITATGIKADVKDAALEMLQGRHELQGTIDGTSFS